MRNIGVHDKNEYLCRMNQRQSEFSAFAKFPLDQTGEVNDYLHKHRFDFSHFNKWYSATAVPVQVRFLLKLGFSMMHKRLLSGEILCQNDVRLLPRMFIGLSTEKIPAKWINGGGDENSIKLEKSKVERHVIRGLFRNITDSNGKVLFELKTQ